ncbi:hypothetical protein [Nonomuraea basaltis]|uniref:hypothetical protein n=1 Tax=Nonomuraea basaltis TaxID=2495887 RepID=UPI00110C5079|nr:hypothetical protein [Nonomuraea basaltis]TMR94394.1 hypothetical protein EJK15_34025 [Nonomuraea basaltis]
MGEVMQANDAWIAEPLRELIAEGRDVGAFAADDVADAVNAILGAVMLGVLGRSMSGGGVGAAFRERLTDQIVRGVLA